MGDETREEQDRRGTGHICRITPEVLSIHTHLLVPEVADMVQRHDHHNNTPEDIDRRNT
jgi:hypothetical protein